MQTASREPPEIGGHNADMEKLSPAQRSEMRSLAHALSPVVIVGDKGLAESVVAEVNRALKAHELIKVKAAAGDRQQREAWLAELCTRLEAHPVQLIGKILVLWRPNPKAEKQEPAKPHRKPARAPAKAKPATRSGRPRSQPASHPRVSEPRRRRPRTSR